MNFLKIEVDNDINKKRERLKEMLQKDDVVAELEDNLEELLSIIPEFKKTIGFDHKHPHHPLNVDEHTFEVIRNLNTKDLELNMAGLLHDISKPIQYQEDGEVRHYRGHPEVSYIMTLQILTRLGFDKDFIDRVSYLVRKHDTIIDVENLDNTFEMIEKLLELQYADARAHAPETVENRIKILDGIKRELEMKKYQSKNMEKSGLNDRVQE